MTYLLVIIINLLAILVIRNPGRFWIVCIPLFFMITGYYFVKRSVNDKQVAVLEKQYEESSSGMTSGAHDVWQRLKKRRAAAQKFNNIMINMILLQAGITLAFQVIGWNTTKKKYYRYTTWSFVIIFLVLLSFWFMAGILPTGGIVR